MNPLLVIVLGWLGLGLETGLKSTFAVHTGSVVGAPSFAIPIVTLIALCAPPMATLWAALAIGLLLDLTSPMSTTTSGTIFLIGPSAIGMVLAAQFVLLVRGMVIRRNPLTLVVLSMAAGVISAICTVAIITVREVILRDPVVWAPTHELLDRLLSAILTGGSALVLGLLLLPPTPLLVLPMSQQRIRSRRSECL